MRLWKKSRFDDNTIKNILQYQTQRVEKPQLYVYLQVN